MATYSSPVASFVDGRYVPAGESFECAGIPSKHWTAGDADATAALAALALRRRGGPFVRSHKLKHGARRFQGR